MFATIMTRVKLRQVILYIVDVTSGISWKCSTEYRIWIAQNVSVMELERDVFESV
jgi:hypothetical protein